MSEHRTRERLTATRNAPQATARAGIANHPVAVAVAALVAFLIVSTFVTTPRAHGSQLIDRDATAVRLEVDDQGEALITYRAHGVLKHVLAWGAVNAYPPTADQPQVAFKLDYAGGWGKYHRPYWKTFVNACQPYAGVALAWQSSACTAPDGSFWALQSWQRELPDYGAAPTRAQAAWELRLSHWTGTPAQLDIHLNWAYRKFDHIFGTFVYHGSGVYGFHSTSAGVPLDTFGRNIYLDSFDSAYGPGWKRENSFLTHGPHGSFCYGLYPRGGHAAGNGAEYRATVVGPGVTPDVSWTGTAPGPYDPSAQKAANDLIRALGDANCKAV
jgi:hypothetical protein